jgi:hypothetical protein
MTAEDDQHQANVDLGPARPTGDSVDSAIVRFASRAVGRVCLESPKLACG